MFKKVAPYIGEYKKYTVLAAVLMSLGIVANVVPYFFLYQIILPLTKGEHIDLQYVLIRVLAVALCEIAFALLYVKGLEFSHISAYNTLKNLNTLYLFTTSPEILFSMQANKSQIYIL